MTSTTTLTTWIPALAKELTGKNYSPNYDMLTHLQAQKVARSLGIEWGKVMATSDVEDIKDAMRRKFATKWSK